MKSKDKKRGTTGQGTLAALLTGAALVAATVPTVSRAKPEIPKSQKAAFVAGLSQADVRTFADRFTHELWPTLQEQCLPCHGKQNASQFLLAKDPRTAFLKLLAEGHFDPENHASIVARITTTDPQTLMPPPSTGELKQEQISPFDQFAEAVAARQSALGIKADELFPAHLEMPYTGKKSGVGMDNTFVTFRQLRGKVRQIFHDDWTRPDPETGAERDLFRENAALFGGADFVKRFDESAKASPTYLTGVDLLGRDIASRAYLGHSGPFASFPQNLPSLVGLKTPSPAYRDAIAGLYRRILLREPTPREVASSFQFLKDIYASDARLAETTSQDVKIALTISDEAGQTTQQEVTVRVSPDAHALTQEFVNQSDVPEGPDKKATRVLFDRYTFVPGDAGQKLTITNERTQGNVSVAGITIRGPFKDGTTPAERWIPVDDKSVAADGAWQIRNSDNFVSYEDNDENKGKSRLTFPISVTAPGQYEISLTWRKMSTPPPGKKGRRVVADTAQRLLVEVVSRDKQSQLATPALPPIPPKGVAEFRVDETVDTTPFADLKTAFQFGPGDGITLSNDGTRKRVVADAVRLLPPKPIPDEIQKALVLRGEEAEGSDKWIKFEGGTFGAYNTVGPSLFQDTDDKGKRADINLTFRPQSAQKEGFDSRKFYRVGVVFPGRVENETHVPITVRARASSPIVQIVYPYHAHTGAAVTLDASASFNVQHGRLRYHWAQVGGPQAAIANPNQPRLTFTTLRLTAKQAGWEGLCRALLAHPDFLFTRPRSLATTTDTQTRRHLQLVKLAQDLIARTPTPDELAQLDRGTPLAAFVDRYLKSAEFADFYFHRTRLYLESHGTPEQDEPARLWTYIALHDRSFKEILTADYTVDSARQRTSRPAYYGRTGVLTMKGFIQGKPSLPHYNYSAQVSEKFLGYVFEVPDSIVQMRDGITAAATTDPTSVCYTCHKVLTPLAFQRSAWDDLGNFRRHDDTGLALDDSDQGLVASYPYKGEGIEAFALQAQNKERFIRTILQTQFVWYFGRELRFDGDERGLYKRLWGTAIKNHYALRPLIRTIVLSPEYLNGNIAPEASQGKPTKDARLARLARFHDRNVQGYRHAEAAITRGR